VQPALQVFFFAQQALVQPALQVLAAQQAFLHPVGQVDAEVPAHELRANAETARTDISDRLLITFFMVFGVGIINSRR